MEPVEIQRSGRTGKLVGLISIVLAALVFLPLMATKYGGSPLKRYMPAVFGSLEDVDRPNDTLVAPFADGDVKPGVKASPTVEIPLTERHLTAADLGEWLSGAVSHALAFDANSYGPHQEEIKPYFTEQAYEQYQLFLHRYRVFEVLRPGNLRLESFAKEMPYLVSEGTSGNHYAWLYEIEMMLSFLPRDARTYKGTQVENIEVAVRVQVGRYADAGEEGVKIELWELAPR